MGSVKKTKKCLLFPAIAEVGEGKIVPEGWTQAICPAGEGSCPDCSREIVARLGKALGNA